MNIQLTAIFFFLFCSAACVQTATAQTGTVQGRVITSDGQPANSVTITVKNTVKATQSGTDGKFILRKINAGEQILVVSFVGLKTQETSITVTADQISEVNVTLDESMKKMDEVIINSNRTQNHKTLSSAKSLLGNMDLPQTVGSVSNTVISDQQATRVGDIVRNVSGVSITQTRLGVNETYTARGYSIGINGGAGSILKNGLVSNIAGMPEAATLESVEVMKGSSAMLYGNVSGGLIVNLVTKKPKFEYGGEVKMQVGSNSQYKPIVDVYGPIFKNLAFRMVGTYENDRSFRDVVKTKRTYFNPSFLYNIGKKTTLLVQGDYLDAKLTPDFGIGTLDSGRVLPSNVPVSRFINVLWAYNNVKQQSGAFNVNHTFNDSWQLAFSGSVQKTDVNSFGAGLPNVVSKTGDWNRTLARAHSIEKDYTTQVNLNGKFTTGKILHQVLVGTDFTRVETQTDAFKITSNGTVVTTYDKINILDPSLYTRRNDIPDAAVTTATTAPSNRVGIYVQDFVNLTDKIKLLAGVRWSYQETVQTSIFTTATQATTKGAAATANNQAFSPKLAIVYQPTKTTSVFGSYSNNFTINTGTDIYSQLLKPSIVDQYEVGVKNNFLNDKLSVNFSMYKIINSNLAQQAEFKADGTLNSDATVKELKGQTTSDGLELDVNGTISKNIYFIAGYGYNNMRFTKTSGAKGSNIEGEQVVINPHHTANFTAFYTFKKTAVKGLKLGITGFYTGDRLGGYNNTIGQVQLGSRLLPLQGFTTVDLSAGYSIKKLSLQCKLANVFNKVNYLVHDNYSITPITPRQVVATVGYKF
ncbi:MAG: TonB-dependent receptor [Ferruginibacter sp.]|uniref:TonB-dependent receptor n=1 Tax=Ferruginibacter sp. TaxID=1940288 RepID=UPI002659ED8C|nr:TonB-dependent receptor [Ferruginibacter sp.]MDB5276738.1 TonB-dependent receptor [Ferruginibacter sp.]